MKSLRIGLVALTLILLLACSSGQPASDDADGLYAYAVRDSFARGDHTYDLGVGSLSIKRPFMTRLLPSYRYSYFPWAVPKARLLRLKRWAEERFGQAEEEAATVPVNV